MKPWTRPPPASGWFHGFAALAEFIGELIVEGTREDWTSPAPAVYASGGRRP
jgi:hypothetical protein